MKITDNCVLITEWPDERPDLVSTYFVPARCSSIQDDEWHSHQTVLIGQRFKLFNDELFCLSGHDSALKCYVPGLLSFGQQGWNDWSLNSFGNFTSAELKTRDEWIRYLQAALLLLGLSIETEINFVPHLYKGGRWPDCTDVSPDLRDRVTAIA